MFKVRGSRFSGGGRGGGAACAGSDPPGWLQTPEGWPVYRPNRDHPPSFCFSAARKRKRGQASTLYKKRGLSLTLILIDSAAAAPRHTRAMPRQVRIQYPGVMYDVKEGVNERGQALPALSLISAGRIGRAPFESGLHRPGSRTLALRGVPKRSRSAICLNCGVVSRRSRPNLQLPRVALAFALPSRPPAKPRRLNSSPRMCSASAERPPAATPQSGARPVGSPAASRGYVSTVLRTPPRAGFKC